MRGWLRAGAKRVVGRVRPVRRAAVGAGVRVCMAAVEHDVLTMAQATAYSAMVALFPALIVAAALVTLAPETVMFKMELGKFFDRVLPSNVSPLLEAYFTGPQRSPRTAGAVLAAVVVSLWGAAGVMGTLMEGFRRAFELPLLRGSFWSRRMRALALVPLSLLPMTAATLLVVFGQIVTHWLVGGMWPDLRAPVYLVALVLRWGVALAGSVGIIAMIYHLGTDLGTDLTTHMRKELEPLLREPWSVLRKDWSWRASLPGAMLATGLWFVATLLFGVYVTRFANYSQVYGSLGAAIALLFWLYIIALSVLIGAEFNAQCSGDGGGRHEEEVVESVMPMVPPDR